MITSFKLLPTGELKKSEGIDCAFCELQPDELLWVDLEVPTKEEEKILTDCFHFHPLAVEDCLSPSQFPKIDVYDSYIFVVAHGINYLAKTEEFTTAEVNIFLGKNLLVTFHDHRMRSVHAAFDRVSGDPNFLRQGLDMLLHLILDRMTDNFFPDLQDLEQRMDELETEVFSRPTQVTLNRIFVLKRDVLRLKRIVFPQREVFNRLSRDELWVIKPSTRIYFRDIYDNLFRMADIADSYRDLLSGLLDAYLSSVSNQLNRVMKILTVLTTVMIPMTVVSGIFGMNFQRIPFGSSPYGFHLSIGLMLLISLGMLAIFKRVKWF